MTAENIYEALLHTLEEERNEVKKLKARCKTLEDEIIKQSSDAVFYKSMFNALKRVIGEDTLYKSIYEHIDD